MTSRECVRRAIRFEEPDKIPIDWGMITLSGIHERAYWNLLNYFGMDEEITVSDPVQHLALPSESILERFKSDTRVIVHRKHCNTF